MEEMRLDCGTFDPDEIARVINEMTDKGTPMRHLQRRDGKYVPDGYVISAQVRDGKLIGNVDR